MPVWGRVSDPARASTARQPCLLWVAYWTGAGTDRSLGDQHWPRGRGWSAARLRPPDDLSGPRQSGAPLPSCARPHSRGRLSPRGLWWFLPTVL